MISLSRFLVYLHKSGCNRLNFYDTYRMNILHECRHYIFYIARGLPLL